MKLLTTVNYLLISRQSFKLLKEFERVYIYFLIDQTRNWDASHKHTNSYQVNSYDTPPPPPSILPNRPTDGQPATIEIHEVEAMLAENTESLELREFPGPLIR